MAKSNPNGANQYQLDPRQLKCWAGYTNPHSPTFGNAKKSAIAAGYPAATANQITTTDWFIEKTRRMNLFSKSEKVLEEMLDLPVQVIKYDRSGDDDEEPESYLATEPALVKIKQDTAKFVAERLGKNEGYSTRTELTGAEGEALFEDDHRDKAKKAIDTILPN